MDLRLNGVWLELYYVHYCIIYVQFSCRSSDDFQRYITLIFDVVECRALSCFHTKRPYLFSTASLCRWIEVRRLSLRIQWFYSSLSSFVRVLNGIIWSECNSTNSSNESYAETLESPRSELVKHKKRNLYLVHLKHWRYLPLPKLRSNPPFAPVVAAPFPPAVVVWCKCFSANEPDAMALSLWVWWLNKCSLKLCVLCFIFGWLYASRFFYTLMKGICSSRINPAC